MEKTTEKRKKMPKTKDLVKIKKKRSQELCLKIRKRLFSRSMSKTKENTLRELLKSIPSLGIELLSVSKSLT